jgi:hypothetical protein
MTCEYCGKPCRNIEELKEHDVECVRKFKKVRA